MASIPAVPLASDPYPRFGWRIPPDNIQVGDYDMRFARSSADVEAIGRLRFDVFNVEMNEGLDASYETGIDQDPFDTICHHLVISHKKTGVVGTYRLQTADMAHDSSLGFYSASEYDLSSLPAHVIEQGVELGRACIAKDHRSLKVLYLLWRGIGVYLTHNQCRYLFGCSSLTSQNPAEGQAVYTKLTKRGHVHPSIAVQPLPDFLCHVTATDETAPKPRARIPRLMRVYLSLGAKVCSPPAIDRQFKTIDYFTLFDTDALTEQAQSYFMPSR